MRLWEEKKFVPIIRSADINAGLDSDSIYMGNALHVCFLLTFSACAGAAGPIIKVYEGAADATKTTALTFHYRYGSAASGSATSDVFTAAETTSAALQIATATLANRQLLIELDAAEMTDGCDWLTVEIGAEADSGVLHATAILEPTYKGATIPTAI